MTVTLPKGGNLLLADEAPGIEVVRVGIGWSSAAGSTGIELDGLVSLVGGSAPNGRLLLAHQVPNPDEPLGAHPPTGPVVGDAEKLVVRLAMVPAEVSRLVFGGVIYDAVNRRQTFRSVRGAYIRVINDANGLEVARYTLEQETGQETAMVFGELYRNPRGWKFRAVGQGYAAGLRGIVGGGGSAVAEPAIVRPVEVTGYLRRTSPARSRRSPAEHLNPPKPQPAVAPKPVPPRPVQAAPPQASKPTSLQHPGRPPVSQPTQPTQPTQPPPAPKPAARPPAQKAAPPRRQATQSSLDLSGPQESTAPTSGASLAGRSAGPIVFGEHSSRYRQRQERVAALDDQHPVTTWTEDERGSGAMTVTLAWEPLKTASGLPRPSDIQLGAFWQAGDRSAGVIQTLGNAISAPGALGPRQVLRLGRRDEREGQTIFVDLVGLPTFRRFFVFAYGTHGSPEWALLRPVLTVSAPSGEQLTIRLGDAPASARVCVVASFHVAYGDLIIRRENDYLDGLQVEAATRYGWALEWNPDGMTPRNVP